MSQDASKNDTVDQLQGAENSETYSLGNVAEELHPELRDEAQERENPEIEMAEAPELEAPAIPYESLSESEIASAIAQAVASSFRGDPEPREQVLQQEEAAETQVETQTEFPTAAPESAEVPDPVAEAPVQKPAASDTGRRRQKKRRRAWAMPKQENKTTQTSVSDSKPAPAPEPAVKQELRAAVPTQVPNDSDELKKTEAQKPAEPKVSTAEAMASLISDIRRRQQAALPPMGASLRTAEQRLSMMTRIDRVLSPVRYIILVLMAFCLAGRKYAWMSLGFMSGIRGTFVALILTILALLVCWRSTYRAIRDAIYLRFSYETYLLVATILTMSEALATKNESTLLPLLTMAWCLSGTANLMQSQGDLRALRAVITGRGRVGVRVAEGKWEHTDCIGKAPATTQGFVRRQAQPDVWHRGNSVVSVVLFLVCLVSSVYLSVKTKTNYLTVLVTLLDVSMPVSMALCCARPYEMLCRALTGKGAVSGWFGMKSLSGKKAVLIYDSDLFPRDTIGHKGIRVCSNQTPRLLASYGASLVLRANMGLTDVFTRLLRETDGELYDVTNFKSQEGGLEGRIHGNRVQVGSYQYMQLMGVTLPPKASKNSVYIAINGEMSGIFAISYKVHTGAVSGFHRFVREPRLTPLVVTRNFCVNPAFVESWFKAPVSQIACPKAETRRMLSEPSVLSKGTTCGFVLRQGIGAYSRMVSGARAVYRMGLWYTVFSALLTIVLTVRTIMALNAGTPVIDGPRLLLLQIILLLAVEIGARISVRQ